jgi:hypothetical protein
MHLVNQGQLAAALILAGVTLPAEFNLEESVVARKDEELRGVHPKLDKVALDLLAQVAAAKDLAAELDSRKVELEAGLPAGASAAEVAIYKRAHTDKTAAVLGEIANIKAQAVIAKAHEDAEAAVLEKHGLMRDKDGALVPFVETPATEAAKADTGDAPETVTGDNGSAKVEAKPGLAKAEEKPADDPEKKEPSIN